MKTPLVLLLALLAPVGVALAQTPVHSPAHPARSHSEHPPRAHSASHELNPVGIYDLDLDMHGQVTGAVLNISKEKDGKLTGKLEVHGQSILLETVTVESQVVTLSAGDDLTLTLTFKNATELLGKWVRSDQSGTLSGVRRKQT